MRASMILTVGSVLTFVAAFVTRHAFFADVAPISWIKRPRPALPLVLAYLLLSIENVAAAVAAISIVADVVLRSRSRWFLSGPRRCDEASSRLSGRARRGRSRAIAAGGQPSHASAI